MPSTRGKNRRKRAAAVVREERQDPAPELLVVEAVQVTEPMWVTDMHAHYRSNGFYRPQDLDRVLGDPRTHVELPLVPVVSIASMATSKK